MQVRHGRRGSTTRLALPPELAATPVPPLLLQPLVENAIKHGLEPHVDGGRIEVSAAREGDRWRSAFATRAPASARRRAAGATAASASCTCASGSPRSTAPARSLELTAVDDGEGGSRAVACRA